jgi:hypothetical protein
LVPLPISRLVQVLRIQDPAIGQVWRRSSGLDLATPKPNKELILTGDCSSCFAGKGELLFALSHHDTTLPDQSEGVNVGKSHVQSSGRGVS